MERRATKDQAKNWCIGKVIVDVYDQRAPPKAGPMALKKLQMLWLNPVTVPIFSDVAELLTKISTPVNVAQATILRIDMANRSNVHSSVGWPVSIEQAGKRSHTGTDPRIPYRKQWRGPNLFAIRG
jgi:hypothetical protein